MLQLASATRNIFTASRCGPLDGRADQLRQQLALQYGVEEDCFPRVRAALGRTPVVAQLATPQLWAQLRQLSVGMFAPLPVLPAAFRVGFSTEEAPAHIWMNQFRPSTTVWNSSEAEVAQTL